MVLRGSDITINEQDTPTWAGIRQKGFDTVSTVHLRPMETVQGMRLGLTAYYNKDYHYEIYLTKELDIWKICWQNISMIYL